MHASVHVETWMVCLSPLEESYSFVLLRKIHQVEKQVSRLQRSGSGVKAGILRQDQLFGNKQKGCE